VRAVSGGNIDSTTLGRIIDRGLAADRRLLRFQLMVKDSPGHLMELASVIAGTGANVKDIFHDRAWTPGSIDMVSCLALPPASLFPSRRVYEVPCPVAAKLD